jgi:outer membrane receptor protein involved in Fe transport
METRLSYSFLDPGDHTTGRPGHKADLRTEAVFGASTVSAALQYVGDYYAGDGRSLQLDNYAVIDVRLRRSLAGSLGGFISVKNLTNEDYSVYTEIPGGGSGIYRMPGRRYLIGFGFQKGS